MTPLLAADCVFAAGDGLVQVRSNRGAFVLSGRHVAGWLEQLVPHLDGRQSLAGLTAALPPDRREVVVKLVGALVDEGVVRDLDTEVSHGLSESEAGDAAAEIDYIDCFGGSGGHRFANFRQTRVLVSGPPVVATALMEALGRLGSHQASRAARDGGAIGMAPDGENRVPVLMLACEHVGHEGGMIALNRAAWAGPVSLLPILMSGSAAWMGPVVRPGVPGCWECARRRFAARDRSRDHGGDTDLGYHDRWSRALLAHRAAFEVFKLVTGSGKPEVEGQVVRIDLRTGESRYHRFHPHPRCRTCTPAPPRPGRDPWSPGAELEPGDGGQTLLDRAQALIDPNSGILLSLGEAELLQLPLCAARATAADPAGGSGSLVATEAGRTRSETMERAIRSALARYGELLWGSLRGGPGGGDDRAWDLVEDRPCQLPPELPRNPISAGGSTWAEALSSALLGHWIRLIAERHGAPVTGLSAIDLAAVKSADAEVASMLRLVDAIGIRPCLGDASEALGVPAVVLLAGSDPIGCAVATSQPRATAMALEAAVAHDQLRVPGRFELRVEAGSVADLVTGLVRWLREHGWRPVAVPLDHDAAVATVCPDLVAVVLTAGPGAGR